MNSYDKIENYETIIFKPIYFFRKNKIKLYNNDIYNNLEIKFHEKLISFDNQSDVEILESKIKNFLIVMSNNCKNFNSNIFYKNFKKTWFDLKKINNKTLDNADGSVRISTFLNILELKKFSPTYHELLHLASLKSDKKIYIPFNEGYTQLLEERYFGEATKSYFLVKKVMNIIELIMGRNELEKLYFSGNFTYLNQLFQDKNPNYNLDSFYQNINYLLILEKGYNFVGKEDFFQKCINQVFQTLLCCFLNNNLVIENIDIYKEYFCFGMKSEKENKKYIFYSIEEDKFNEIINEYKNKNYK